MKSFLVIGMGRFGRAVALELYRMKYEVQAVDMSEDKIAPYMGQVTNAIIGDTTDAAVLRSLGVDNFDCVIIGIGEAIENSIWTLMILKELGAKMIICKARDERHAKIMSQLGADKVIRPENDMGIRVAHTLAHKNVMDFHDISTDHSVIEIVVPSKWAGKSIAQNNLRKKHRITVVYIKSSAAGTMDYSPGPETMLYGGDIITIIGKKKDIEAIHGLD